MAERLWQMADIGVAILVADPSGVRRKEDRPQTA
jgi:hypothetical protein